MAYRFHALMVLTSSVRSTSSAGVKRGLTRSKTSSGTCVSATRVRDSVHSRAARSRSLKSPASHHRQAARAPAYSAYSSPGAQILDRAERLLPERVIVQDPSLRLIRLDIPDFEGYDPVSFLEGQGGMEHRLANTEEEGANGHRDGDAEPADEPQPAVSHEHPPASFRSRERPPTQGRVPPSRSSSR